VIYLFFKNDRFKAFSYFFIQVKNMNHLILAKMTFAIMRKQIPLWFI